MPIADRARFVLLIAALCGLIACSPAAVTPTAAPAGAPAGAAQDKIKIASPVANESVQGPNVTVTTPLNGVTLVPVTSATKKEDLHAHYFLDVDASPYLDGKMAVPANNPNIIHAGSNSATFNNVPAGSHKVTILLTYSDHTAVQPPVAPAVSFQVK